MQLKILREAALSLPAFIMGRTPGQLIIQTTDHCNAACPQCGMRKQESFKRSRLDKASIKRIIDRAVKNRVRALSFTGGEPFLFRDDLFECIRYAADKDIPYIRTGTNGFMFMGANRPGFADRMDTFANALKYSGLYTFWISLDSWDIVEHEDGRGLMGVTDGIRQALPVLKQCGIYPSANLGINRKLVREDISVTESSTDEEKEHFYQLYREGFRKFYNFASSMGFTIANACYPMSAEENAVYKAESSDRMVSFNKTEKHLLFKALYDEIPFHRGKIRIFTPRSSLLTLVRTYGTGLESGYACRGGIDYFFVNSADGCAYPCGFRINDSFGKYEELNTNRIKGRPHCRECDWECFRDPSNHTGPVTGFFRNPIKTVWSVFNDREFFKDWITDTLYYIACGMFNFRKAPEYGRMALFNRKCS